MQNTQKMHVGLMLVALSVAFFFVILSFTTELQKLNAVLHEGCTLPAEVCPYNRAVPEQSVYAFTLDGLLGVAGAYLMVTARRPEKRATRAGTKLRPLPKNLEPDENKILSIVADKGAVFQSELVEKSGMNKVKVTRVLDRLEGLGFVERKRRGMTNMVVMKQA